MKDSRTNEKRLWIGLHLAMLGGMVLAFEKQSLVAFLVCFVMFCQLPSRETP